MSNNLPSTFNDVLLEQYKLYVEMTDRLSARRNEASKFYTSLLTALLALIPFILGQGLATLAHKLALLGIGAIGAILCFTWVVNINSYKQLASLKFKVIEEMEHHLPYQCYSREWQILGTGKYSYRRLNKVERIVPILFGILCLIIIIASIANLFR
jgi:hypothetical protein